MTRVLPSCCLDAVEHKAVPVLFALIQSLNRSKPHLQLLEHALNILFNLASYAPSRSDVFEDHACIDVVVELLQTQRDHYALFLRATQLLITGCNSWPGFSEVCSIHADFMD